MATITKTVCIDAPADAVWDALRDFGALHQRLVRGFVVDTHIVDTDRIVTFFNGAVARERLVAVDDESRRLVYAVVESPLDLAHDNSAAQVFADGDERSRFVWTKDILPDSCAPAVAGMMERAIVAIKATIEAAVTAGARSHATRPL